MLGCREVSESPRDGCSLVIFLLSNLKMVKSLFNEVTAAPRLILGPAPGALALFSVPSGSWGRGSTGKQLTNGRDPEHSMLLCPAPPSVSMEGCYRDRDCQTEVHMGSEPGRQ